MMRVRALRDENPERKRQREKMEETAKEIERQARERYGNCTLQICKEDDVEPSASLFSENVTFKGEDSNGKSWGHWRSAGKLNFRPDGTASGQFLDLCCDLDPSNRGHGHRSCFRCRYAVVEPASIQLFAFEDDDLNDDFRSGDFAVGDGGGLKLSNKELRGSSMSRQYIGSCLESQRMEAAAAIMKTRYHCNVFAQRFDLNTQFLDNQHAEMIVAAKKKRRYDRVLGLNVKSHGDKLIVTCVAALSGEEVCTLELEQSASLGQARAKICDLVGSHVLTSVNGKTASDTDETLLAALNT